MLIAVVRSRIRIARAIARDGTTSHSVALAVLMQINRTAEYLDVGKLPARSPRRFDESRMQLISINAEAEHTLDDVRNQIGGRTMRRLIQASLFTLLTSSAMAQSALEPAAQRGLTLVRTHCARCHSIDRVSASPLAIAPPFRTLHKKYPVENLEEALGEGISTGHPTMPEFRFDPGQVTDIIAYLKTLER
jgi:cytochrome c553